LQALEDLRSKFEPLEARIQKFQKRMKEKDPITQEPRYGTKTAERVRQVLELHHALQTATWIAFGMELEAKEQQQQPTEHTSSIASQLRLAVDEQAQLKLKAEAEALEQQKQEELQQKAAIEKQRQQEEAERQQALEARRREDEEVARRAEQLRQAQRQEQEAAAQAERDWIDSITKGPEGVRQQIQILKHSTADDPVAQNTALSALLAIFTQIAQHPEELNFRRIRRDHPKFHQDIGRHKGGQEILIAAGFKLVILDDIPCFYSKEPNLETDMDGWSEWFENIKQNLQVVKEMQ